MIAAPMLFELKPNPPSALDVTTHKGKISVDMICTKPLRPYIRVEMKTPRLERRHIWEAEEKKWKKRRGGKRG